MQYRKIFRWGFALFFLIILSFLGHAQRKGKKNILVMVDHYTITKEDVFDVFAKKYSAKAHAIIQELIIQRIILLEAKAEKLTIRGDLLDQKVQGEIKRLKREIQLKWGKTWKEYLEIQKISEKKLRREIRKKWKYSFALWRLVRLAQLRESRLKIYHIKVNRRYELELILEKLRKGANFVELAKRKSIIPQNQNPQIVFRGDLPPKVEKEVWKLKPFQYTNIVQSPTGFHLIQLLEIYPGKPEIRWRQEKRRIVKFLKTKPVTTREFKRWLKKMEKKT